MSTKYLLSCRKPEVTAWFGTWAEVYIARCSYSWKLVHESHIENSITLQLKTVAFIAGKKNPAIQKKIICFSIEIKLKKGFQRWDCIQNSI